MRSFHLERIYSWKLGASVSFSSNGLLSAGAAAEAAGLKSEAMNFYKEAALQTHNAATSNRPELLHAVEVAGTK